MQDSQAEFEKAEAELKANHERALSDLSEKFEADCKVEPKSLHCTCW